MRETEPHPGIHTSGPESGRGPCGCHWRPGSPTSLTRAFPAAQFEGSEKSCLSPSREEKGRAPPRLPAATPKPAKALGTEPSSPLGEWTDPALPLEDQVCVSASTGLLHGLPAGRARPHRRVLSPIPTAGTTGPSAEPMPRTCFGCARRPATWCATARPARMTSPCPSSEWAWGGASGTWGWPSWPQPQSRRLLVVTNCGPRRLRQEVCFELRLS